ncbi:hypothetical protein HMPREF1868_00914 [Olsenella sp. DNF00959]|nr:hypothetical protein HMPREF1868_00914 [Olsenella sp. DNF00959]
MYSLSDAQSLIWRLGPPSRRPSRLWLRRSGLCVCLHQKCKGVIKMAILRRKVS